MLHDLYIVNLADIGGKVLCFVSLRVDLPTVWHGLGCWERCGNDEFPFPVYYCLLCLFCNLFIGVFGRLPLWSNPGRAAPLGEGTTRIVHNGLRLMTLWSEVGSAHSATME